jgi:hypothetical protein
MIGITIFFNNFLWLSNIHTIKSFLTLSMGIADHFDWRFWRLAIGDFRLAIFDFFAGAEDLRCQGYATLLFLIIESTKMSGLKPLLCIMSRRVFGDCGSSPQ